MTVTVETALENAILGIISSRLTLGPNGRVSIGCEKYAQLMKWVMDNNFISNEEISAVVHRRICQLGRREYEWCVKMARHPDHVTSREALGYAMRHYELSKDEVARIPFDHGETTFSYTGGARDLLKDVMHKIRHPLCSGDH